MNRSKKRIRLREYKDSLAAPALKWSGGGEGGGREVKSEPQVNKMQFCKFLDGMMQNTRKFLGTNEQRNGNLFEPLEGKFTVIEETWV